MMRYYCKETGSTYIDYIHGASIPHSAVPITDELYLEVIANPAPGKIRSHDAEGLPILIDPPVHVPTADDHRANVAAERYRREIAGITLDGKQIDTGRDSQALITGAALASVLDPEYSCQWKTPAGFVQLNSEQIIGVASAVRAHVQACFDREAELLAEIDAGTYSEEMLSVGWPA